MKFSVILSAIILTMGIASPAMAAQRITVVKPEFNFGNVTQGQKIVHVFTVKNDGDQPLNIIKFQASCGCTAAQTSSKVVAPGKSAQIKVTFDSANFSGAVHKTIAIQTDDPKTPNYTLGLKGTILEEITVEPHQRNVGVIKIGESKEVTVTITNNKARPLKLISVSSPVRGVSVKADKKILKKGEQATITLSVTPQAGDRTISGYIAVVTDNPRKKQIFVAFFGSVVQ